MNYQEFRRAVVSPYWCNGSPLEWTASNNAGIAFFAKDGRAGMFNLAWLVLGVPSPPADPGVYSQAPVFWVIKQAPVLRFKGRTLEEYAALNCLPSFRRIVSDISKVPRGFDTFDMTFHHFQRLLGNAERYSCKPDPQR